MVMVWEQNHAQIHAPIHAPTRFHSEGGFFNAKLTFPPDYPNKPPKCRFTSEMWHPNGEIRMSSSACMGMHACHHATNLNRALFPALAVFADGTVCISILHDPGDDPNGYETASERWSPVQSVSALGLPCPLGGSLLIVVRLLIA